MARNKIIPKEEATDALLKFREKRKWQLSMRRYVLERKSTEFYAPYFGLDIENFRKWIELQFDDEIDWKNFGAAWQFDHIVPVNYFDFSREEDLRLCWSFINIRVGKLELNNNRGNGVDIIAAKPYFKDLYNKTGYSFCLKMIEKINEIELSHIKDHQLVENFIIENKQHLEMLGSLSKDEFNSLNQGISLKDILLEREILKKFS